MHVTPDRPTATDPERVHVVGVVGGECFGAEARAAVCRATVIVGSERHMQAIDAPDSAERIPLTGALDIALDTIARHRDHGARVTVLASGDPGFFGIVRALGERFGPNALSVHPAPSSVSLAFARLGSSWDDAIVVSAHGRPLDDAITPLLASAKAAVFTSPDNPPEAVGAALIARGCAPRRVAVMTRLGEADECVFQAADLDALARGSFDPMSIVVLQDTASIPPGMSLVWGLAESEFAHRDGMITKAEVRAVALGKLGLPPTGVLWDVGAGSGSVAVEAARLAPGLRVFAIERDRDSRARIVSNAEAHRVAVDVVEGSAPDVFASLPDPDRVFVGGGGTAVLDAALARLRPGGTIVANYALLDRAVVAWQRLGNLAEISVARAKPVGSAGVRLAAENPVFVCWGPDATGATSR